MSSHVVVRMQLGWPVVGANKLACEQFNVSIKMSQRVSAGKSCPPVAQWASVQGSN